MAAWKHYSQWNEARYKQYRNYAANKAPGYKGRKEDCADLSIMLLIDFAAANGLPITFKDVDDWFYISKAWYAWGPDGHIINVPFFTKEMFTTVVQKNIQTKSLWYHNTVVNPSGPEAGDLMMKYTTGFAGRTVDNHTALVFSVLPPGKSHPKSHDPNVKIFPGREKAKEDFNGTEYIMGTVDKDDDWATTSLDPDKEYHFDYLNSRGDKKRNAELIYYANKAQLLDDGFEFRRYAPLVLDNWSDWDGEGYPPRGPPGGRGRGSYDIG
jgi:hypothetical protein